MEVTPIEVVARRWCMSALSTCTHAHSTMSAPSLLPAPVELVEIPFSILDTDLYKVIADSFVDSDWLTSSSSRCKTQCCTTFQILRL